MQKLQNYRDEFIKGKSRCCSGGLPEAIPSAERMRISGRAAGRPRRGRHEPGRRIRPVRKEIAKKRRHRAAAGGLAGSAGQGLPLCNPCRSPAAAVMKLPVCPGERNLTALIRSTRQLLTAPVRATNTFFNVSSRPNQITSRPAQRSKTATERYRCCSGGLTEAIPSAERMRDFRTSGRESVRSVKKSRRSEGTA